MDRREKKHIQRGSLAELHTQLSKRSLLIPDRAGVLGILMQFLQKWEKMWKQDNTLRYGAPEPSPI